MSRQSVRAITAGSLVALASCAGCAKADNSGVGTNESAQASCARVCPILEKATCKCSTGVTSYCEDLLSGPCQTQQREWLGCFVKARITCADNVPQVTGCETQINDLATCQDAKANSCATANDGTCDKPPVCASETDTNDCTAVGE